MRPRQLVAPAGLAIVAVVGIFGYRYVTRPRVTVADQISPDEVRYLQTSLSATSPTLQVLIDFRNPYLADVTRLGNDTPTMLCSTQTYFDADVSHKGVRAVTALTPPGSRPLKCWTSANPGQIPSPPS